MKKFALLNSNSLNSVKRKKSIWSKFFGLCVFLLISQTSIAQEGTPYDLGNEQVFTQKFWNKKSNAVHLNVSKDIAYDGLINVKKGTPDDYAIIGSIHNDPNATFHITKQDGMISGEIVLYKEKIAYRYYSDDTHTVLIKKIDIHKVLCIDFQKVSTHEKEEATGKASLRAPILESLPGSEFTVYLDFDGEVVSNTWWVNGGTINAQGTGYSDAKITNIWRIMAEDFRPFDINITTNRTVFDNTPINKRMMCIFTPTTTAAPGSGGVAYLNSFSNTSVDNPCWVYNNGTRSAGETGSHEVGHTLGLSHDGVPGNQYYAGHGEWSPIMGWSASKPIGQWSSGEYDNAITQQDDMAIISGNRNGFGYKTDDHGDQISEASDIAVSADGTVDPSLHQALISTRDDKDVFSFITAGGEVNFTINPDPFYPNLNIQARILTGTGEEVAISNPFENLSANITTTLASGTYFIEIDGVGEGTVSNGYSDYSSVGFYEISGSYAPGNNNQPPIANFEAVIDCNQVNFQSTTINTVTDYLWNFGDGNSSTEQNPTHTYTEDGVYTISLTATNTIGEDTNTQENLVTITVASLPESSTQTICEGAATTITASGSTGYIWYDSADSDEIIATGETLDIAELTENTTYYVAGTTNPIINATTGIQDIDASSGNIHQGGFNLVFDSNEPIILKKAKVRAEGSGNRTLQLRDESGAIIESKILNIPDGENVIEINMNIPAGTDLAIGFIEGANLFRSNDNINYPYVVENVINIKRSSATTNPEGFYYYLYNWEIATIGGCQTTERAAMEVVLSESPAAPTIIVNSDTNEISTAETYDTYQWYLNDQPIEGANNQNYFAEEAGIYMLEVFNAAGCSTLSESIELQTLSIVAIQSPIENLVLYPNPTRETLYIDGMSNIEKVYSMKIVNSLGQIVVTQPSATTTLNTSDLATGFYFLLVNNQVAGKFVKTLN